MSWDWTFVAVMVYVAAQLAIGAIFSRTIVNEKDYLLAGRKLGMWMATLSIFATWFGAELCVGTAGEVYLYGMSGTRADPFGYAICILLLGFFFAAGMWRRGLTTLGDLFRMRYGVAIERLAVFMMVPTSIIWAGAQIRAFGQVLAASSSLEVNTAIGVAAGVVITYTVMGGLFADAITDLVQGIALVAGLVIVGVMLAFNLPSGEAIEAALSPERLAFRPEGESFLLTLDTWLIPIVGSLFAQELISRTLAAKSPSVARNACLLGGGVYLVVGMVPLALGLLGPALLPGLTEDDYEQFLPMLAREHMHPVFFVAFAGALVSAILSTVDSCLLAASALFAHNLVIPVAKIEGDQAKLRVTRACTVGAGLLAFYLAVTSDSVVELIEATSTFATAGIFTTALMAFAPRFGGRFAAGAALLLGVAGWWYFNDYLGSETPYIFTLMCAMGAYAAIAVFERVPEPAPILQTAEEEAG